MAKNPRTVYVYLRIKCKKKNSCAWGFCRLGLLSLPDSLGLLSMGFLSPPPRKWTLFYVVLCQLWEKRKRIMGWTIVAHYPCWNIFRYVNLKDSIGHLSTRFCLNQKVNSLTSTRLQTQLQDDSRLTFSYNSFSSFTFSGALYQICLLFLLWLPCHF